MAKTIVLGGDKGGSGKTTSSHAIAHGLAMYGIKAFHISTDPRREILPPEARRYATLDGRDPRTLGTILDRLAAIKGAVALIDGGGGRPDVDRCPGPSRGSDHPTLYAVANRPAGCKSRPGTVARSGRLAEPMANPEMGT